MRKEGGKRERGGGEAQVKVGVGNGGTGIRRNRDTDYGAAQATQYPLAIIIRAKIVSRAGSSSDSLPC